LKPAEEIVFEMGSEPNKKKKKVSIIIFKKILHIIEKKIIIKTSPFFYE